MRYKSFAGFSVEICVPEDAVAYIERGRSLQSLLSLQDLHVDVGNTVTNTSTSGEAVPVRSVLATGTVENVHALQEKLRQVRVRFAGDPDERAGTAHQRDEQQLPTRSPEFISPHRDEITEANRKYRIRLLLPKVANNQQGAPSAWDRSVLDKIRTISREFHCSTSRFGHALRINGRKAEVQATKNAIQTMFNEECDKQGIPHRNLQVLQSLEPSDNQGKDESDRIEHVKTALRALTNPIVLVVATLRHDGESSEVEELRGVTVSSLTSVTLDRRPIVSFNLRLPSRTWDAIESNRTISLSFLTATPEAAAVANVFTKPHDNPDDAFRELRRLGYEATGRFGEGARRLVKVANNDQIAGTVYCTMAANVLRDNSVSIRDHVIVVAEVTHILLTEPSIQRAEAGKAFGLAYGNREYRRAGEVIQPMQLPKHEKKGNAHRADMQADSKAKTDLENTRPGPGNDHPDELAELHETFDTDNSASEPHSNVIGNDESAAEQLSTDPPPEGAASADGGLARRSAAQSSDPLSDKQTLNSLEQMEAEQAVENGVAESQDQPWPSVEPDKSSATKPPATTTPSAATQAEPRSSLGFLKQIWRSYSTSARRLTSSPNQSDANATKTERPNFQISDPSLLSTTAGDFLNRPDDGDPYRLRRMRALMKARKESENASNQLKYLTNNGKLTKQESERLNNIITRNERWIAKKLALHSAYDLRLMLDKGKVDVGRARWLESSIEKGQAVLIEEMQQLEDLFVRRKVDGTTYNKTKESLEQDALSLSTEALRLRQMVEEEDGGAGPVQQEKRGFDGFSGNF